MNSPTATPPHPPRSRAVLVGTCRVLAVLAVIAPLIHIATDAPFARQCTTVATPAILAVTIGVELMFNAYFPAVLEIAALALTILYGLRLPPEPVVQPVPIISITGTASAMVSASAAPSIHPTPRLRPTSAPTSPPTAALSEDLTAMRSGAAICTGNRCTLSLGSGHLPEGTQRVCLDAPGSAEALQGVQPVCTLEQQGGAACHRSDKAAAEVTLTGPITWRLCP